MNTFGGVQGFTKSTAFTSNQTAHLSRILAQHGGPQLSFDSWTRKKRRKSNIKLTNLKHNTDDDTKRSQQKFQPAVLAVLCVLYERRNRERFGTYDELKVREKLPATQDTYNQVRVECVARLR